MREVVGAVVQRLDHRLPRLNPRPETDLPEDNHSITERLGNVPLRAIQDTLPSTGDDPFRDAVYAPEGPR